MAIQTSWVDPDTGLQCPSAVIKIRDVKGSLATEPLTIYYDIYYSMDTLQKGLKPVKENLRLQVPPPSIVANWVPALKTQGYVELSPSFPGAVQV